jgi:hypothetical protein
MIYEDLVTLNAESSFAHVGLGKVKFFEKDLTKAKEFLTAGIVSLHDSSSIFHIKNKQELVLNNLLFFQVFSFSHLHHLAGISCLNLSFYITSMKMLSAVALKVYHSCIY